MIITKEDPEISEKITEGELMKLVVKFCKGLLDCPEIMVKLPVNENHEFKLNFSLLNRSDAAINYTTAELTKCKEK